MSQDEVKIGETVTLTCVGLSNVHPQEPLHRRAAVPVRHIIHHVYLPTTY